MIRGLGTDIVDVERIRVVYQGFGERFGKRILSPEEYSLMQPWDVNRRVEFLAGRFAAKEAIGKACGLGIGRLRMNCVDMQISSQGLMVRFCPESTNLPHTKGRWHVSISHTSTVAYAVALWEDEG